MIANQLPAWAIEAARLARTAALRIVSPAERRWRSLRGAEPLPPLWLRRHAGPIRAFSRAADDCRQQLLAWNAFAPAASILDLGCGPGAMALSLRDDLAPPARYLGIDVHAPSIRWCRDAFGGDRRFRFETADVASPFGAGTVPVGRYRVPAADGSVDLVIAKSLFTHLTRTEAMHYLGEIRRVLAHGGAALVTAFLFGGGVTVPAFPHGDGDFRWRIRNRPAAAAAFGIDRFAEMLEAADLWIEKSLFGFHPGTARVPTGQDALLLRRKWLPVWS